MTLKEKIKKILSKADLNGFTQPLKGELKRYVVAYTNNVDVSLDKIAGQTQALWDRNSNLNIGGWRDSKTGKVYIDISTSLDDLEQAKELAKKYNQIAIWDNMAMKEIRI